MCIRDSCYGVQAAANVYFGKDVSELSVAESASIIGITNAPGAYNPFTNPENNKKRQEDILYAMFEQGYLTQQEYDDAVAEELVFTPQAAIDRVNPVYSYFTDYAVSYTHLILQHHLFTVINRMQGIRCNWQLNVAASQPPHCQKLRASQKTRIAGALLIDIVAQLE